MDTDKISLFTLFDAYRAAYRNNYGTQNLLNADNSFDEIFGIESQAPVQGTFEPDLSLSSNYNLSMQQNFSDFTAPFTAAPSASEVPSSADLQLWESPFNDYSGYAPVEAPPTGDAPPFTQTDFFESNSAGELHFTEPGCSDLFLLNADLPPDSSGLPYFANDSVGLDYITNPPLGVPANIGDRPRQSSNGISMKSRSRARKLAKAQDAKRKSVANKKISRRLLKDEEDDENNALPVDRSLSDDVNFDLLLREARSQDPGVLKCPFPGCKDSICSVNNVSPHFREAHGIRRSDQNKWVACLIPNCGGGAKPKGGNLVRHYKEHILKGDCLRCEFSTSRNSDMKVHVRDRHGIEVEKAEYFTYKFKF